MLDLAIVNGTVVDGTGSPESNVDLGIADGRIVQIAPRGEVGPAARVIDAAERIVTPGFIDPHTHMDAQLFWDPTGSPSLLHGVTSVVIGSCGFGIAPIHPDYVEYSLRSLEAVEEIPYEASRSGLPLTWKTWPEFFQAIGELDPGVNVAGFVPHSALRVGVLGAEGLHPAITTQGHAAMLDALDDALAAGAIGVSSSRGSNHTDASGDPVPSRLASDDEVLDLVRHCRGRTWQMNIRAKGDATEQGIKAALSELSTYRDWSEEAGATLTWTPLAAGPGDRSAWPALLEYSRDHAAVLVAQVSAQAITGVIGFDGPSFAPMIDGWAPAFTGFNDLDHGGKVQRMKSTDFRAILKGAHPNCRRITGPCYERWRLLHSPTSSALEGLTLSEIAGFEGQHPADVLIELAIADDLATIVELPLSNVDEDSVRTMVTEPTTMIGLGDAGAHINSITNYTYPTYVLSTLVRDKHWMTLPEAVRRMTSQPARVVGVQDRGVLTEGAWADVCVIDMARLSLGPVTVMRDLPGDATRLHRGATGYSAVIVNGNVALVDDKPTNNRTGRLLRR